MKKVLSMTALAGCFALSGCGAAPTEEAPIAETILALEMQEGLAGNYNRDTGKIRLSGSLQDLQATLEQVDGTITFRYAEQIIKVDGQSLDISFVSGLSVGESIEVWKDDGKIRDLNIKEASWINGLSEETQRTSFFDCWDACPGDSRGPCMT